MKNDVPEGHFDRHEKLTYLLENHTPARPEEMTVATHAKLGVDEQKEFAERRARRIAGGIVVVTPELTELGIEVRRAEHVAARDIGRTGVILNGPPTCGKTTAAFNAMLGAFERHVVRHPDWKRDKHIPVVYIEVPPGSTARGIMGRFLRFFQVEFFERMTLEERTQAVTKHLQRAHTSLIVIDEMQNLARLSNGTFDSAQAIKNLLNSVKAVPLYVGFGLDQLFSSDYLGLQFASRSTEVRIGRLGFKTEKEKNLWRALVRAFESQFALFNHPKGTLDPHAEYLWRRTSGSIGALSRLLTVAALDLVYLKPKQQLITVELLHTVKLDLRTEELYDAMMNPRRNAGRRAA